MPPTVIVTSFVEALTPESWAGISSMIAPEQALFELRRYGLSRELMTG